MFSEKLLPKNKLRTPVLLFAISILEVSCANTKKDIQLILPEISMDTSSECMAFHGGIPQTKEGIALQAEIQMSFGRSLQDCFFDELVKIPNASEKLKTLYANNKEMLINDLNNHAPHLFEILSNEVLYKAAQIVHKTLLKLPFSADENVMLQYIVNTNPKDIAIKVLKQLQENTKVIITKSNRALYLDKIIHGVSSASSWKVLEEDYLKKQETPTPVVPANGNFSKYHKDLMFLLEKKEIPKQLRQDFIQGRHYGYNQPSFLERYEQPIQSLDKYNNAKTLSKKERRNFLKLLSFLEISSWSNISPASLILKSNDKEVLLSDKFLCFLEKKKQTEIELADLSLLLRIFRENNDIALPLINFSQTYNDIVEPRRKIFRTTPNRDFQEDISDFLTENEKIKLTFFLQALEKNPETRAQIKEMIEKDILTTHTEFGGTLNITEQNKVMIFFDIPKIGKNNDDGAYNRSKTTTKLLIGTDFLFHFHAPKIKKSLTTFSGPSEADRNTSKSLRKDQIVFTPTTIKNGEIITFNIDYIGRNGDVLDLGVWN